MRQSNCQRFVLIDEFNKTRRNLCKHSAIDRIASSLYNLTLFSHCRTPSFCFKSYCLMTMYNIYFDSFALSSFLSTYLLATYRSSQLVAVNALSSKPQFIQYKNHLLPSL